MKYHGYSLINAVPGIMDGHAKNPASVRYGRFDDAGC